MRSRHGAPLLLRLGFLGLGLLGLGLLGLGLLGLGLLLLGLPGQFALRRRRARARARPGAAAAAAAVPCPTAGGPRARAPPAATAATAYVALACAALGSSLLHDPHDRSLAAPVSEVGVIQSPDGVQHGLVVGELYNPHERTATVPLDVEEVVRVQIPNPGAHEILQGLPRGAGRDALHKHPVLRALAPRSPTGASRPPRARLASCAARGSSNSTKAKMPPRPPMFRGRCCGMWMSRIRPKGPKTSSSSRVCTSGGSPPTNSRADGP